MRFLGGLSRLGYCNWRVFVYLNGLAIYLMRSLGFFELWPVGVEVFFEECPCIAVMPELVSSGAWRSAPCPCASSYFQYAHVATSYAR